MFAASYFAPRYFTDSYWTKVGAGAEVEVPVEPPFVSGPPRPPPREIPFERINALAKGKVLVLRLSLIPGDAIGNAKAVGGHVLVVNAVAGGVVLDAQRWQVVGGSARSKIVLTDEEEIMLILADAA